VCKLFLQEALPHSEVTSNFKTEIPGMAYQDQTLGGSGLAWTQSTKWSIKIKWPQVHKTGICFPGNQGDVIMHLTPWLMNVNAMPYLDTELSCIRIWDLKRS